MVKVICLVLAFCAFGLQADTREPKEILYEKVKGLVDEKTFYANQDFIKIIFSPESKYFHSERLDVVSVKVFRFR